MSCIVMLIEISIRNDMLITLCIVKLAAVGSIYGYFAEDMGWSNMYTQFLMYAWFYKSEKFLKHEIYDTKSL